ncbi:MAG: hypothetical protein N2Z70_07045, partial [Bdellovibrionaceae bacterium]|nr:hypothetical protein [Pseudobdellovibrionaceae bacterium]
QRVCAQLLGRISAIYVAPYQLNIVLPKFKYTTSAQTRSLAHIFLTNLSGNTKISCLIKNHPSTIGSGRGDVGQG